MLGIIENSAGDQTWYLGNNALKDMIVTFDAALLDEGMSDHLYVGISKYGAGDVIDADYIKNAELDQFDVLTHPIDLRH